MVLTSLTANQMRGIVIAFVLFFSVENCSGRYHRRGHGIPLKESTLWDEGCKDDPDYADGCPEHAAIEDYCKDQEAFMRKHCPKSCKFCSEGPSLQPAPIECKDDPSYDCKDIAQTEGLCKEQEAFTRASCALSCGWCVPSIARIPAPEICEADLPKWAPKCPEWADAGECDNPKRQSFMQHYCRKSCKLPCKPESTTSPETKPPSPPAFCRDRDINCARWKSQGDCESKNPTVKHRMSVYCGVTCDTCREPTPEECYDKGPNCTQMKNKGYCHSTVPVTEYEVKTNCLETCEFCDSVPDQP